MQALSHGERGESSYLNQYCKKFDAISHPAVRVSATVNKGTDTMPPRLE